MIPPLARLRTLCTLGLSLFACAAAPAQKAPAEIVADLNPASVSVHWTLNTTLHTVHGTFKLKSGSVRVDPSTGIAAGVLVLDATSAESGDRSRDKTMHRDVLESERFPEILFHPTRVSGKVDLAAPSDVTMDGTVTLLGRDHPMQLLVHLQPQNGTLHASTHFKVPYVAWGLKDPSTFIFRTEKEVSLDIDLTAPLRP